MNAPLFGPAPPAGLFRRSRARIHQPPGFRWTITLATEQIRNAEHRNVISADCSPSSAGDPGHQPPGGWGLLLQGSPATHDEAVANTLDFMSPAAGLPPVWDLRGGQLL